MKKIVIHKAGAYDQLKVEEFDAPVPKKDEVLIDVHSIGVNYADCLVRWGVYKSAKEIIGWPITPGFEVSGTVIALGPDTTQFKVGDKVIGVTLFNGYSTQLCLPEEQVFKVPENISLSEAAGISTVYLTAYHGLFQNFVTRPGMQFLIHSAAGGVGTALIQLSKHLDCEVVGIVGRKEKKAYLEAMGVDKIICKDEEDWVDAARKFSPKGYHAVFDANGASTLKQSYDLLAPTGKLMVYGFHSMLPKEGGKLNWLKLVTSYLKTPRFSPLDMTSENKSVMAFNLSFLFEEREILKEAFEYVLQKMQEGKLKPLPVQCFQFEDVAKAHRAIESGSTTGKLILTVPQDRP